MSYSLKVSTKSLGEFGIAPSRCVYAAFGVSAPSWPAGLSPAYYSDSPGLAGCWLAILARGCGAKSPGLFARLDAGFGIPARARHARGNNRDNGATTQFL